MKAIMIAAATLCGRISPAGFASKKDRRHLEILRHNTDASLLGAESLREGDPEMKGLNGEHIPGRIRSIITRSGKIPVKGKRLFEYGPQPLIFTASNKAAALAVELNDRAEVIPVEAGRFGLSIQSAMSILKKRGVESLLIEGGGKLNYACLAEGVVDEIVVTVAPYISGRPDVAFLADGPLSAEKHTLFGLELLDCRTESTGEIFTRYKVKKNKM